MFRAQEEDELKKLGLLFSQYVQRNQWEAAKVTGKKALHIV
jgi:hypothetical protein